MARGVIEPSIRSPIASRANLRALLAAAIIANRKAMPVASHRPLEHTADVGVEIDATSLEELYAEAAIALADTLTPIERVGHQVERELQVEAADAELLLVDYLNELLFLFETEGLLVAEAGVELDGVAPRGDSPSTGTSSRPVRLRATVRGERYDET